MDDHPGPDQDPVPGSGGPDKQRVRDDQHDVDGDGNGEVVAGFL